MALTGRLLADFSSFKQAVEQAQVSLRGMETGAGKVSTSLNRMVDSFSGRKLIQDATLMTEAINRIGGASVLTASEQKRVNDKVTEAIEKYRALGQQAPADMLKLADATKQVEKAQGGFVDQLKASIPTTQSLIGQVQTLALGYVSGMVALQGFERVGRAAFDFIVGSIKAYTDSEDATRRLTTALRSAGEAAPETIKQFEELSKQYQRTTVFSDELIKETESLLVQVGQVLPSEMDQALQATTNLASGLGIDLRSATLLVARAFEDNFTALKKAGVVIDEARAKSEGMVYVLGQIQARFGGQAQSEAASYAGQIKQLGNEFDDLKEEIGKSVIQTGYLQIAMAIARAEITKTIGEIKAIIGTMQALAAIPGPLGAPFRALGVNLLGVGKGASDLSQYAGGAGQSVAALGNAAAGAAPKVKQGQTAVDAYAKALKDLIDTITGRKLAAELAMLAEAVRQSGGASGLSSIELAKLQQRLSELAIAGIKLQPELEALLDIYPTLATSTRTAAMSTAQLFEALNKIRPPFAGLIPILGTATIGLGGLEKALKGTGAELSKIPIDMEEFVGPTRKATKEADTFSDSLQALSQSFALLAQISGGAFGGVVKDIGTAIAAMNAMQQAVKSIEKAMQGLGMVGPGGFSPRTQGYINTAIVGATTGYQIAAMTGTRSGGKGAGLGAAAGAATAAGGAAAGAAAGAPFAGATFGISVGVGAIAGAIGGYLAARKAAQQMRDANNEASKSIAEMQKQLIAQYGPLENIARLGEQVGVGLAGAWGDQSIEGLRNFQALTTEFQTKVKALQDAVEEFGLTWKDLGKDQQLTAMQEAADTLVQKFEVLEKAGYDMGVVTAKSAGALLGLLGDIAEVGGKIPAELDPAIKRLGGMSTISDDNADALNKYIGTAIGSGQKIPAALQPIIEKLIRMGKLTDENARAMLGLSSESLPALNDIKAAADRYGLTLEQIGGKAMQIQITEQAKQAVADWELLTSLGGDFGAIMVAMAPQVQSIVNDALKFGQQLPESMKPMIQAMIEAGQLTDDTGQKLTDISQLDFAADPTKKTQELIDKLGGFIDVLTGGDGVTDNLTAMSGDAKTAFGDISDNAKKAADAIKKEFSNLSFTIPITYDFTNAGQPTGGSTGYAAGGLVYAAKGWPWVPKGSDTVPAMLTPGERVLSLAETAKYDAMMGGGSYRPSGPIIIKTYLNSRQIAEEVVPEIPGVVKRYGLTR